MREAAAGFGEAAGAFRAGAAGAGAGAAGALGTTLARVAPTEDLLMVTDPEAS